MPSSPGFILVDGDNFYVSCERLFNPRLEGKPVVVLSNNDGCIVARSREAKKAGIPMGAPAFRFRSLMGRKGITSFSSNYALYADISRRVAETLSSFGLPLEIYSIDESFLQYPSSPPGETASLCREMRERVGRWVGVPVSVGAAATKTLAKLAVEEAKKNPEHRGSAVFSSPSEIEKVLARTEVGEIWGIGRRSAEKLSVHGVRSALDLALLPDSLARKTLGVTGQRTAWELRGTPCFSLETAPAPPGQIIRSRSFGRPVVAEAEMRQAVAVHVSRAAEKLRARHMLAGSITVFVLTDRFRPGNYSGWASLEVDPPTDLTGRLIETAFTGLDKILRPGLEYRKAGVIMSDMSLSSGACRSLFPVLEDRERQVRLVREVDRINARWGRDTVRYAVSGTERAWEMRREKRSPRYTTCWNELPLARA